MPKPYDYRRLPCEQYALYLRTEQEGDYELAMYFRSIGFGHRCHEWLFSSAYGSSLQKPDGSPNAMDYKIGRCATFAPDNAKGWFKCAADKGHIEAEAKKEALYINKCIFIINLHIFISRKY
jgi:hypothetical protein